MRPLLLWLLVLPLIALPLRAQTVQSAASATASPGKPELPTGPLLHPADNFSQWEVTFVYPDDQEKEKPAQTKVLAAVANARPRKVVTTKTGNIVHELTTDVLDRTKDVWFSGGSRFTKEDKDPVWYQADSGHMDNRNYNPLPANGFRGLDWISANNFVGIVPYAGGRQCLVFTPGGTQKLDLSDASQRNRRLAAADTLAYIDADTRQPVAVRTRSETSLYHFDDPPTQMQTLPPDLATQIKKGEEGRSRLNQLAPRPY